MKSSISGTPHQILLGWSNKDGDMGRACSMDGSYEIITKS
jgi:hypothetical protein